MKWTVSCGATALAVSATLLGAGCSGGGSGPGDDGPRFTLTPTSISSTRFLYEVTQPSLVLTATKPWTGGISLRFDDPAGVIGSYSSSWGGNDTTFVMSLETSRSLAAGIHEGAIVLHVCYDSATTCARPVNGSPWRIPYRLEVIGYDLSALSSTPDAGPWSTSGGNAGHSGFVPGRFDPSRFRRRWWLHASVLDEAGSLSPVAVEAGRVFMITNGAKLWAFSEDTGEVLWTYDGAPSVLSPPAAANGRVYVATYGELLVLDASTGALVSAATIPGVAQTLQQAVPPTPSADGVYVGYGESGRFGVVGIAKFDALTGEHLWTLAGSFNWENAVPVISGGVLLTGDWKVLNATSTSDGTPAWNFSDPSIDGWRYGLVASDVIVCTLGGGACLDTATRALTAFSSGTSGGVLSIANGVAYLGSRYDDTTLDARSVADGALLWSSTTPGELAGDVVVTDNVAFVKLAYSTVAVDLATREVVWSFPTSGSLALSDRGVLYVVDQMTSADAPRLLAFNLR